MSRLLRLLLVPLALAGCSTMPRDAAGTTDRIERTGLMRIAILPTTPDAAPAPRLLGEYAADHGARVAVVATHGEHALRWLTDGRVSYTSA